jgi:hypothetical protein
MIATPKRRWFRFSLRTPFVLVTIAGVWLGYQCNIVRERKKLRALAVDATGSSWNAFNRAWNTHVVSPGIRGYTVSWVRKLFGDESTRLICLSPTMTPEQVDKFKWYFPEAFISISPE